MTRRLPLLTLLPLVLGACVDTAGSPASVASAPGPQEQACLARVSSETANPEVTVISNEFSEANSVVVIGVGPERAPWRCLVSNDGVVAEVFFMGSEGLL